MDLEKLGKANRITQRIGDLKSLKEAFSLEETSAIRRMNFSIEGRQRDGSKWVSATGHINAESKSVLEVTRLMFLAHIDKELNALEEEFRSL